MYVCMDGWMDGCWYTSLYCTCCICAVLGLNGSRNFHCVNGWSCDGNTSTLIGQCDNHTINNVQTEKARPVQILYNIMPHYHYENKLVAIVI